MFTLRRLATGATMMSLVAALSLAASPGAASAATPALPQLGAARAAGAWLAGQVTAPGWVPGEAGGTSPSLSATAQTVLALSAAGVGSAAAQRATAYLEANVGPYVTIDNADGPGQLALLILDAKAEGLDPTTFGGTNLVTRLLATQQTSGADAGLFGTDAQAGDYAAGGYQQGLALTALAAVGVKGTAPVASAVSWLVGEQCPNGGWTTPDNVNNDCAGDPSQGEGPDTNATSLAVQGLAAQGALTPAVTSKALAFFAGAQDADAGWSYAPNTSAAPQSTDPDSTALVIQGLLALGVSPTGATYAKGSATPVSALLSYQVPAGAGAGAFSFPPSTSANIIATYQSVPALARLTFPWGPLGTGYWEAASDGGIFAFGGAGYYGSMGGRPLVKPVVGLAPTTDGHGYWEAASDGGIFAFGDAGFHGSMGGQPLAQPIVGVAATPDGGGYWEVAADGGVFAFGDAGYYGSTGAIKLAEPVVGIAATPDGGGYWLVASDGGVFAFGDAGYQGSTGAIHLAKPVVGIAASPDGHGYWTAAADGGIFAFGDAGYHGSTGGLPLVAPVVGLAAPSDGGGYWEAAADGGIFAFGDAGFSGSTGGITLAKPVVAIAANPARIPVG